MDSPFFFIFIDKPIEQQDQNFNPPYDMIRTISLSVCAAVVYIIVVLGLMFYCKKRRKAKRLTKKDGDEPEMECLNGEAPDGYRKSSHDQEQSYMIGVESNHLTENRMVMM